VTGVRWHGQARRDLRDAVEWYALRNRTAAVGLIDSAYAAIARIRDNPLLGSPVESGVRRILLKPYPYSVFYTAEGRHIRIIAFAHQRRRPDYWRDRVKNHG
jgi:toxin ParE1/3/4